MKRVLPRNPVSAFNCVILIVTRSGTRAEKYNGATLCIKRTGSRSPIRAMSIGMYSRQTCAWAGRAEFQ